jgi:heat shock protein HslJ
MKRKLVIYGLSTLMIGMVSCKSKQKETQCTKPVVAASAADSRNLPAWEGFYSGVLPCADCSGIQISLELSKNQTYTLRRTYIGKGDDSFDSSGKITLDKKKNRITFGEGEDKMQFLAGENSLTVLDREGKLITGELAAYYILVKVDTNLVEKYWKLTELSGEPVVVAEGSKEAHIILQKKDSRVSGNGGCNNLSGMYALTPGNGISFTQMALTQMMCLRMDTETRLKQTLETADRYETDGDMLLLKAGENALARFKAVYMQ